MKFEDMINKVILGDSYKLIKNIPAHTIDCVYIDIPYLYDNFGDNNSNNNIDSKLSTRIKKLNSEELKDISAGINFEIFDELMRVLKEVNIFIWCSKLQIIDILNYFNNRNIRFEILTWNKTNPTPATNGTWLPDIEYCLYFRKNHKLNDGYDLKSKWYLSSINKSDKDKYGHPTIKPLELVKRHLLHTTNENDLILDCFCGSGTTCVAAKETNRRYIGIEINEEYYKCAVDRLNGILKNGQTSIFTDFNNLGMN